MLNLDRRDEKPERDRTSLVAISKRKGLSTVAEDWTSARVIGGAGNDIWLRVSVHVMIKNPDRTASDGTHGYLVMRYGNRCGFTRQASKAELIQSVAKIVDQVVCTECSLGFYPLWIIIFRNLLLGMLVHADQPNPDNGVWSERSCSNIIMMSSCSQCLVRMRWLVLS